MVRHNPPPIITALVATASWLRILSKLHINQSACLTVPSADFFPNLSIYHPCSVDCVKWGVLPQVTEEMRQNCSFVKGRFTGDPSYEYEHTESKRSEDSSSDPGQDEETTVSFV